MVKAVLELELAKPDIQNRTSQTGTVLSGRTGTGSEPEPKARVIFDDFDWDPILVAFCLCRGPFDCVFLSPASGG